MGQLGSTLQYVNSSRYTPANGWTKAIIQAEKRNAGIFTADPSTLGGLAAPGVDLEGYPMSDSAVLIDYNYVLTCAHTVDSLFALGSTAQPNGKVWVVFNNEYTASTVDSAIQVKEVWRPYAYVHADQEVWAGQSGDLDYALVKIEWHADMGPPGRMANLPNPDTFRDSQLRGKQALFLGQYTGDRKTFSTHVAQSAVSNLGVVWDGSPPVYTEMPLGVAQMGPSGSGIYDLVDGKPRLVGIFGKGLGGRRFFLPLDKVYADTVKATGTKKGGRTIGEVMRDIYKQRVKDGMPQL